MRVLFMAPITAGNSEHAAHGYRKIGIFEKKKTPICDSSRSSQKLSTEKITKIASYVRADFWVTL